MKQSKGEEASNLDFILKYGSQMNGGFAKCRVYVDICVEIDDFLVNPRVHKTRSQKKKLSNNFKSYEHKMDDSTFLSFLSLFSWTVLVRLNAVCNV